MMSREGLRASHPTIRYTVISDNEIRLAMLFARLLDEIDNHNYKTHGL